jgi:hypothetical protein
MSANIQYKNILKVLIYNTVLLIYKIKLILSTTLLYQNRIKKRNSINI